jgi:putative tryptophan/tyrosine transport system substrate-binding protein
MTEKRKLAAILAADVVGFSRLTGSDEEGTLARLRTLWSDLIAPTIAVHNGRVVKRTGDGSIIEFRSVVDAVRCAIEVQNGMMERNAGLPPERRIEFRVGIHLGDVVEESDGDLMGDGVNIVARLEGIADPGGICLSEDAYRQVRDRIGWTDGRTVAIKYRWSEGRPERVAEIAAEFVQQKVNVIVTYGAAVATFKQATTSIPIVLLANDPVGSGLVASLSRPGGNVTGVSLQAPESAGRRLELLRQIVPSLRRLAILFYATYPAAMLEKDNVEAVARNLGLEVQPHGIRGAEDIAPVFDALKGRADALYVIANSANGARIATLALSVRLPTTFEHAGPVRAGALMSYGPDLVVLSRRQADFVDKILHGAKPGELPIEQPTKFNLAINLKTAEALGLTVPPVLVTTADEVIE